MATTARDNLVVILGTNFHSRRNILCIFWVDNGSGLKCVSEVTTRDGMSVEFGTSGERRGFTSFARVGVV